MENVSVHYRKGNFRVIDAQTGGFKVERFYSFQARHWDCSISIADGHNDRTISTVPSSYWALWATADTLEEAIRIADAGLGVPLHYWSKWAI